MGIIKSKMDNTVSHNSMCDRANNRKKNHHKSINEKVEVNILHFFYVLGTKDLIKISCSKNIWVFIIYN